MKTLPKILLSIFLLFSAGGYSQQAYIDSLAAELKTETDDSVRAVLKYKFGEATYLFRTGYWDSLAVVLHQYNLFDQEASAINNLGMIHDQLGNTEKALECHNRSFAIHESISNLQGMSYSLNNVGMIYDRQGLIEKALESYFESLRLKDEIGDEAGAAYTLNNIGILYKNQNESQEALEYFFKSLEIREKFGKPREIAYCKNNIGIVYSSIGEQEKAVKYLEEALELRTEANDIHGIGNTHNNLGETYLKLGDLERSQYHYEAGLSTYEQVKHKYGIAFSTINLGRFYTDINNWAEAEKLGKEGLKLAQELAYPDLIKTSSNLCYKVAKEKADYRSALEYYENYVQQRDSINNESVKKATIRQQTKYEFEKEQLIADQARNEELRIQHEELNRRNNLQYSLIFLGILLFFGMILGLGFVKVSSTVAEGLIFFAFLIFFEFLLVLGDPYVEGITGGEPVYKLFANAVLAGLIFPAHAFFERVLKRRLIR